MNQMSTEQKQNTKYMKGKINFSSIQLDSYNAVSSEEYCINGKDYVMWGENNKYPYYLYDIYSRCATLQSIINGSIDFTIGNGINISGIENYLLVENEKGDTLNDTIKRLITDRWIFGGFAIKLRYNVFNKIASIEWVDFRNIRVSEDEKYVFVFDFDKKYSRNKPIKYLSYLNEDDAPVKIFYYKGTKTRGVYPISDYSAAIVSAETQIEIQEFHYNNIINNFSSNKIVNFNNADQMDDNVREEIERKVIDKYTGSKKAGTLMVSFNGHKDNAMTVEGIPDDSFDTKYNTLSPETRENLFISMRAQPQLFGLNLSTGFNEQEFNEAFQLYNKTAIVPKQDEIKIVFGKLFPEILITFKPFSLDFDEVVEDDRISEIPESILNDLTQDERRALIGYESLEDEGSNQTLLAERLGVGGTEALISVITNTQLSKEQKAGTLRQLFSFTDEQIKDILGNG